MGPLRATPLRCIMLRYPEDRFGSEPAVIQRASVNLTVVGTKCLSAVCMLPELLPLYFNGTALVFVVLVVLKLVPVVKVIFRDATSAGQAIRKGACAIRYDRRLP